MKTRINKDSESFTPFRDNEIRNRILNIFTKSPSLSIRYNHLFSRLKISKQEKAALRETLRNLVLENILNKSGKYYELATRTAFYEGKVILDKELGYAIETRIDNLLEKIQVKKRNLQTALLGDIVQFTILEYADNEIREAIVEKLIKRTKHIITGNLQFSRGNRDNAYVLPDDTKFRKEIFIPAGNLKSAKSGDKVICEIINWEYQDLPPEGKIIEVLGKAGEVETELKSLLKKYGLNKSFPKNVRDELKNNLDNEKFKLTHAEISRRLDLRDKVVFTIDPEDAKDFDDAVQIEKTKNGNYLLGVHIADVSFYVREGTKTDEEAAGRGTSVYLMNNVVPMLPEKLSNDLCSLKESKDRLTFSVQMEINQSGDVVNFNLNKSIINSSKRFSYEEVQKIINEQKGPFLNDINLMNELHCLKNVSTKAALTLKHRKLKPSLMKTET